MNCKCWAVDLAGPSLTSVAPQSRDISSGYEIMRVPLVLGRRTRASYDWGTPGTFESGRLQIGWEIRNMFTGLVEGLGHVVSVNAEPPGKRLVVQIAELVGETNVGDSIAVNGCCLTVVELSDGMVSFDAGPETLKCTNLGQLGAGSRVNIERSLKAGDRLGGHFVTGHVDAVGRLDERRDDDSWSFFTFRVTGTLTRQMASKGCVAVDGVSLTLVDVESERFSVALIPHTLNVTTLGRLMVGGTVNLETDLLAKYVEQQLDCSN